MTILVTGATGFIGSHLVKKLTEGKEEVVALGHSLKLTDWLWNALEDARVQYGDIRNLSFVKEIMARYEVDTVYHLAAESIVKRAHRDPVSTFSINIMGTVNVLEACRQLHIPKLIIQSTDKIYGDVEQATVYHPYVPTEPYGTSKICADAIARTYIDTYDENSAIVRVCNVYGYDLHDRIIPNTIRACLNDGSPFIFNEKGGHRQYIYIDDYVAALQWLTDAVWIKGPLNITTKPRLGQETVVKKILEFFPQIKPTYIDRSTLREIPDQSIISSLTGWQPKFSFEQGIEATIAAFRHYRGW